VTQAEDSATTAFAPPPEPAGWARLEADLVDDRIRPGGGPIPASEGAVEDPPVEAPPEPTATVDRAAEDRPTWSEAEPIATTPAQDGELERHSRIIAIANQKGGVGKSTTAVNLGAALAEAGSRVLVVDLDPQGNASTGLGIDHTARERTTYEVLTGGAHPWEAIVETAVAGLWALPSTIDLAGAEIELVSQFARESRLAKAMDSVRADFDYVLLDCPPSIGLLTVNALTAAEEVIVPIQCEYYALEGLGQLLKNVRLVQQNVNPRLRLTGILMTMFDARTKLADQVVGEVRAYFGPRVYETVIPRTVRLSEAPGYGQPITTYDSNSKGAEAYRSLAREVMSRGGEEGVDLARLMGEETFGRPMQNEAAREAPVPEAEEPAQTPEEPQLEPPTGGEAVPVETPAGGEAVPVEDPGSANEWSAGEARDEAEATEGGRW
jgi:chromosome partitioning protein